MVRPVAGSWPFVGRTGGLARADAILASRRGRAAARRGGNRQDGAGPAPGGAGRRRAGRRYPATVVATARSAPLPAVMPLPAVIERLWRDGHCERIELAGLSDDEAGELLETVLDAPADLETSAAFVPRAQGIRCCCANSSRPPCSARPWSGGTPSGCWTGSRRSAGASGTWSRPGWPMWARPSGPAWRW